MGEIKKGTLVCIVPEVENIQKPKEKSIRRMVVEVSPKHNKIKMFRINTLGENSKTMFWYNENEISLKPFI